MSSVNIPQGVKGNLLLAHRINREIRYDGFMGLIVEGVQRVGKSAYVSKGLAYANGEWDVASQNALVSSQWLASHHFSRLKLYLLLKLVFQLIEMANYDDLIKVRGKISQQEVK